MYNDDSSRDNMNIRKPGQGKYGDKNGGYSPSANYNYGHNGNYNNQHHPRRRVDRFKRDTYGHSERLVKQNDIIIRLLKEIRDRLPAPENLMAVQETAAQEPEQEYQDQAYHSDHDAENQSGTDEQQEYEDGGENRN